MLVVSLNKHEASFSCKDCAHGKDELSVASKCRLFMNAMSCPNMKGQLFTSQCTRLDREAITRYDLITTLHSVACIPGWSATCLSNLNQHQKHRNAAENRVIAGPHQASSRV